MPSTCSGGNVISTQRLLAPLLASALLLAGCARGPSIETPLPDALGGLRAAPAVELDAERVAADAVDVRALGSLLADAGFQVAVERTYSGPGSQIRRVAVRVLRFEDPDGAERYLSWLRAHPDQVIGDIAETADTDVGPLFVHEPGGCCPKELPLAMAAWRAGSEVVRVIVAGPEADGAAGGEVVARVRELTTG